MDQLLIYLPSILSEEYMKTDNANATDFINKFKDKINILSRNGIVKLQAPTQCLVNVKPSKQNCMINNKQKLPTIMEKDKKVHYPPIEYFRSTKANKSTYIKAQSAYNQKQEGYRSKCSQKIKQNGSVSGLLIQLKQSKSNSIFSSNQDKTAQYKRDQVDKNFIEKLVRTLDAETIQTFERIGLFESNMKSKHVHN